MFVKLINQEFVCIKMHEFVCIKMHWTFLLTFFSLLLWSVDHMQRPSSPWPFIAPKISFFVFGFLAIHRIEYVELSCKYRSTVLTKLCEFCSILLPLLWLCEIFVESVLQFSSIHFWARPRPFPCRLHGSPYFFSIALACAKISFRSSDDGEFNLKIS